MVAGAMAMREESPGGKGSNHGMAKTKSLAPSPALSSISTIAFSDVDGFSDDEDCGDMSSEEVRWSTVGSRLAPVFACLRGRHISEGPPVCKSQFEIASVSAVDDASGDEQWHHGGLRNAAISMEAAQQADLDDQLEEIRSKGFLSSPGLAGGDSDVESWGLVGLRLAQVFSTSNCDGESTPPTTHADYSAAERTIFVIRSSVEE